MNSIKKFFAFILGVIAFGSTMYALEFLSERNGADHLRSMIGAMGFVIFCCVIHVVVLSLFGLIKDPDSEPMEEVSDTPPQEAS